MLSFGERSLLRSYTDISPLSKVIDGKVRSMCDNFRLGQRVNATQSYVSLNSLSKSDLENDLKSWDMWSACRSLPSVSLHGWLCWDSTLRPGEACSDHTHRTPRLQCDYMHARARCRQCIRHVSASCKQKHAVRLERSASWVGAWAIHGHNYNSQQELSRHWHWGELCSEQRSSWRLRSPPRSRSEGSRPTLAWARRVQRNRVLFSKQINESIFLH